MAEKKAILVLADSLDLNASGEALDALRKKAALLPHADCAGLAAVAEKLGAVKADASGIQAALDGAKEDSVLVMVEGDALAAAALLPAAAALAAGAALLAARRRERAAR